VTVVLRLRSGLCEICEVSFHAFNAERTMETNPNTRGTTMSQQAAPTADEQKLMRSQIVDITQKQKLAEVGGFRYEVASEELSDAIVTVLSESFSREPMSAAMGLSAHDLKPLVARFMPECATNGLSVIAVPVDDPGTLAGVFISRDFKSPMPEGLPDETPLFIPIGEALTKVDEAYEANRPGLTLGDAVDLWMVGVLPDSRFARKGIASTLFRLSADLALCRGFKRCVTECTGQYSQTAARRNGFHERARLAYRDFRFKGRAVFAGIEAPHTHVILFEREF
jgi:hypothetical protein